MFLPAKMFDEKNNRPTDFLKTKQFSKIIKEHCNVLLDASFKASLYDRGVSKRCLI